VAAGLSFNGAAAPIRLPIENMPGSKSVNLSNGSLVIGLDNIAFANTAI